MNIDALNTVYTVETSAQRFTMTKYLGRSILTFYINKNRQAKSKSQEDAEGN